MAFFPAIWVIIFCRKYYMIECGSLRRKTNFYWGVDVMLISKLL